MLCKYSTFQTVSVCEVERSYDAEAMKDRHKYIKGQLGPEFRRLSRTMRAYPVCNVTGKALGLRYKLPGWWPSNTTVKVGFLCDDCASETLL